MKKLLVLVIAVALVAWVVSWFRVPEAVATSTARPWPGGMGTVDAAHTRYPSLKANAASGQFTTLAKALPNNEVIEEFVAREIVRAELTIGQPPALPDITPIRELLLREPLVWERRVAFDDVEFSERRALLLNAGRTLVASALAKARANDAAAWEDLHAVWKLARSLDPHPQMMAQTAAMTLGRTINAVAWKMPLPAPPWLAELQQRDQVQPLLGAFQYQVAAYSADGSHLFPTKWLADSVERDRSIAEALVQTTTCDVTTRMNELGADLSSVWRRAFRYRAEREATANALRVREGKPIETKSVCSDGAWSFDGTTLRFSRDIATAPPDRPMPLVLRLK